MGLLYIFSSVSKRLFREIFSSEDADRKFFKRMHELAPQVFVGLKTGYRLHSMKNVAYKYSREMESIQSHVQNKNRDALVTEDMLARVSNLHKSAKELAQELEDCLNVANGRKSVGMKQYRAEVLCQRFKQTVDEWTLPDAIGAFFESNLSGKESVLCDLVSMEHAFRNVVENAIYFLTHRNLGREHRKLTCEVRATGGKLRIRVEDTAGGFSERDRNGATEAFYSGAEKKGTGLGLWMSERIAVDHGGSLAIENVDNGAAVTIVVPLKVE